MSLPADAKGKRLKVEPPCLTAALENLERGWSSQCCCPPDHLGVGAKHSENCRNPGKAVWGWWKKFQERRPTEEELRAKWRDLPNANVGLALGPVSGLVRVDVDGPTGEKIMQEISGGDLPDTLEFTSPSGGRGLLYKIPEGLTLKTRTFRARGKHEELRFQGKGAVSILPPSRHPDPTRPGQSDGLYSWRPGHGPHEIDPEQMPHWLISEMSAQKNTACPAKPLTPGERISEGGRNSTLTSFAGTMRRRGMGFEAISAALQAENANRCDPPLSEDEVLGIAKSVARYSPSTNGKASPGATSMSYPPPVLEEIDAQDLANSPEGAELEFLPLLGRNGYFVKGWSHLLAGYPRCGKTELLGETCREWLLAGYKILFFTEESRSIWHKRTIQSPGPLKGLQLVLALGRNPHDLLGRMMAGKEDVVVVDTIRNLNVLPCDENDNAAVARALSPWVAGARERNKTLALSHHTRKGAGEHGEGIAGGHALLGAVDIALEIRRDTCPTRRLIKSYARLIQPADLLYERNSQGRLVAMGDPKGVRVQELRRRVIAVLSVNWLKTTEVLGLLDDPKPSDEMVRRALTAEAKTGAIERSPAITVQKTAGRTLRWRRKGT